MLLLSGIAPSPAREFRDDAGRTVTVPERVQRVFAAGPPASILLYTLAPETMLGWPRANSKAEAAFMPPQYAGLPELGRLTGRGDTANVEVVLASRPDILFDYGTIDPTYMSLADRVQQQTRLPYLLIDGRFERIPEAYRTLGRLLGLEDRAEKLARYAETTLADAPGSRHRSRRHGARASIMRAVRKGWRPACPARSMSSCWTGSAPTTWPNRPAAAVWPPFRSSRSCNGTPTSS
jgi:ABC-type Fe3+-hydroxamate transport system substrate-binding protein